MQTQELNWNRVSTEEAADIFKTTFGGNVHVLPTKEVLRQLRKASMHRDSTRALSFVKNNDEYEYTTYAFNSISEVAMYASVDADQGDTEIGCMRHI
jgi:hypothetical protein